MEEQFRKYEYKLTSDPAFLNNKYQIGTELQNQFETLHNQALKGGNRIIQKLLNLIEKYPHVPLLKNYLSIAYTNSGKVKKGMQVNYWIRKEHPEYLFGLMNEAAILYEKGEYDKIPEILGSSLELKDLYPERDVFHISEFACFYRFVIQYFLVVKILKLPKPGWNCWKNLHQAILKPKKLRVQ
jgi:hypothetical protein